MGTAGTIGPMHQTHSTWARQLAARRHVASSRPRDDLQGFAEAAIDALWGLFDMAFREVNAALEAMGEPGRIGLERGASQRSYRATGLDGSLRAITVFALLPVVDGQLLGGAHVSVDNSRRFIYITPSKERGSVRWGVATSGQPFTSAVVHDLFLSVFADDPEATLRLTLLWAVDVFQDIWS